MPSCGVAYRLTPLKVWQGHFATEADEVLGNKAPKSDYITDEEVWRQLWAAWRLGEKDMDTILPGVDFEKQLVLVGKRRGAGNKLVANLWVDENGDLLGGFWSTSRAAGPGMSYMIIVVDI